MKNTFNYFIPALFVFLVSCNSKKNEEKTTKETVAPSTNTMPVDSSRQVKNKNRFADIVFASKRDTTCGMPLSAGIEDTLMVNGKIYGFCAKECKDEFIAKLAAKK